MAAQAVRERLVDIAFIRYNPVHRGAEKDVFPHVPARRRTLLYNFTSTYGFLRPEAYETLGLTSAYWQPKMTDYYRFALAQRALDGLLCAPRTPQAVASLARAMEAGPLTEEEHTYLRDLAHLSSRTASPARGGRGRSNNGGPGP
jgi:hypothetical protein